MKKEYECQIENKEEKKEQYTTDVMMQEGMTNS